jgi:predicted TIM-barrel fold metal-dependent hydrolase
MNITRRKFVEHSARAGLALGSATTLGSVAAGSQREKSSGGDGPIPIVDTHQHLWDLKKVRPPWLKPGGELTRNYVTRDYLEATRGLNVVKAVYMEVAVADEDLEKEAELVLELCRRDDNLTYAAVIGGRPAEDGFRRYITRFKDSPYIKGIRQIVSAPMQELWSDDRFASGVRLLGELGMSFDLCVGPELLGEGARLVDRCPDTRFVLDHCGNANPNEFRAGAADTARRSAEAWKRDMAAIAKRPNIVCKISGIVARMTKGQWTPDDLAPVVNHCLDEFGPERVMFASDWPVCTRGAELREWVAGLKEIVGNRDIVQQRKLWGNNAVRFYGLA